MLRLSTFSALAVCAAGLLSAPVASAQLKIGIVNFQRAVSETAEIKKASNDLAAKYKPRQEALEKINAELNDLQTQLQSSSGKLSAAGEADLTARAQRKQRDAQHLSDDLNADVDKDKQEILQRATQRMQEIVKKVMDEKGLDVVMDTSTTVSWKPELEVTNDVVSAYDKAYPVK